MRWRWWRKCENTEGLKDAEEALEREKQAGREAADKASTVQKLAEEASELSADLVKHYRENNFSRLIEEAMHLRRGSR